MSETRQAETSPAGKLKLAALVGVLGVVYGDIGTSPLYALQACLAYVTKGGLKTIDVLGLLSLIFWALIITVTLKYVTFVMRADNNGEGGVLALMALAQRVARTSRTRYVLMLVGIVGAGLFLGDGVITPAISVLSAVEGLSVASPDFNRLVLPIAVGVIVGLFLVQRHGTGAVGKLFGPIMVIWFITIGAFNNFIYVWLTTGGGPGTFTQVLATQLYTTAFVDNQLGGGAAIGLLMSGVMLVFAAVYLLTVLRRGDD